MVAFVVIVIIVAVVLALKAAGPTGTYDKLASRGRPARGILLQVAPTGAWLRRTGVRLEQRWMRVDVEVPGELPYEVNASTPYPANLRADVLPGATVELRVDPKNKNSIAIVGAGVPPAALLLQSPRSP